LRSDGRRNNYGEEYLDGERIAIEVDTVAGTISFFRNDKTQCVLRGTDLKDFSGPYRFGVTLWERSKVTLASVVDLPPAAGAAVAVRAPTVASKKAPSSPGMKVLFVQLFLFACVVVLLQMTGKYDFVAWAQRYLPK
jgi:hypothetical protein